MSVIPGHKCVKLRRCIQKVIATTVGNQGLAIKAILQTTALKLASKNIPIRSILLTVDHVIVSLDKHVQGVARGRVIFTELAMIQVCSL